VQTTSRRPWQMGTVTSHACLALIQPKTEKDGTLYFANFSKKGREGRLFPLETGESGETVKKTLDLCLLSEVADDATHFSWKFVQEWPLYVSFGPDQDDDRPNGTHAKCCFLVSVEGKLREDRDQPDPPDVLTRIEWWKADRLIHHMLSVGTPPLHLAAAKALLHYSCDLNYPSYDEYSRFYAQCKKQELAPHEQAELKKYFAKNFG
jgi:hypothetical protein